MQEKKKRNRKREFLRDSALDSTALPAEAERPLPTNRAA